MSRYTKEFNGKRVFYVTPLGSDLLFPQSIHCKHDDEWITPTILTIFIEIFFYFVCFISLLSSNRSQSQHVFQIHPQNRHRK